MTHLQTERLLLRVWVEDDREHFAALNADPEVMRYFPSPLDRAESDALVDRVVAGMDERGWGLWAVEVVESGEFVGFTGLNPVPADVASASGIDGVEVGWRLARSAWGHGFATEAASAAVRFARDEVGLAEVVSFTAASNGRSRAVMRRIGLVHDRDFDHPRLDPTDPLRHHVLYRTVVGAVGGQPLPAQGGRS